MIGNGGNTKTVTATSCFPQKKSAVQSLGTTSAWMQHSHWCFSVLFTQDFAGTTSVGRTTYTLTVLSKDACDI